MTGRIVSSLWVLSPPISDDFEFCRVGIVGGPFVGAGREEERKRSSKVMTRTQLHDTTRVDQF